ncbi:MULTISPECIES: prephenate dehydrogenase [unclassified Ruminococcus]|uniref:prephenate dehydrogenase n=1 Tax=unclassified Ruminococcus TaxID=2608920 RepID=UPI00210D42CB|nr:MULTISPECIES: prephenate dehydrogenase [unclassified Ruminococcus]MCQ4021564.1 prephenate dehydrogenase/arogenate dehydrogenase family protein [Ruminococcus sp. zg-924]MCQ4114009.1 prephenate dehydrogenase/arogenate dehydrogenase family protein [Ruminococcus sp. zg-921]
MKIAVVGLGIIGGSMAKAIKKYTEHYVIGINRTRSTLEKALECGAIDEIGDEDSVKDADIIILGLYPALAVDFIKRNCDKIKKTAIVTDTSGIKAAICPELDKIARENGFTFIGSHPMAGKETNGFDSADADLFFGASFIVVPGNAPYSKVRKLCRLAMNMGFSSVRFTTTEEHDRMIAYTSQLPHVLACAYVLSPQCPNHKGFSAGSYRDVSRVAKINATLWSELFIENREPLMAEIDTLINNLKLIKKDIEAENTDELIKTLDKCRQIKEQLDE